MDCASSFDETPFSTPLPNRLSETPLQTLRVEYRIFPEVCHDIRMKLFLDGQEAMDCYVDSWKELRIWLEAIIVCGHRAAFAWAGENRPKLKFEYGRAHYLKSIQKIPGGEHFEHEDCCEIKLFEAWGAYPVRVVHFWGVTKQVVQAFYESFLGMIARDCVYCRTTDYEFEQDFERTPIEFYNEFRSRDIEFVIYGTDYNAAFPRPPVKNIVFMFCDWDSLFWEDGLCCGNAETITLGEGETEREINLKSIPGLASWSEEFIAGFKATNKKFREYENYETWFARGFELARQVRALLPPDTDLWYGGDGLKNLRFVPFLAEQS